MESEVFEQLLEEVRGLREAMERVAEGTGKYDKPMTRDEAAAYLQVHPDTLYRWAMEGMVAYSRMGDGQKAPLRFTKEQLIEAQLLGRRFGIEYYEEELSLYLSTCETQ